MKPQEPVPSVWAYGKVEPGWYIAKGEWGESYASDLRAMGYDVERSVKKPTRSPVC